MKGYFPFLRKELTELAKTYKLLILAAVLLLFGLLSPVAAKFMPKLLEGLMTEGFVLTLPEPTILDAWAQFGKNIGQIGFLVLVILFSGLFANEISKGTFIPLLTKGLSRTSIVLAKGSAALAAWTLSCALAAAACWYYARLLFPGESVLHLPFALFCLWAVGALLLCAAVFFGTLFRSVFACLLGVGGTAVAQSLLSLVPSCKKYLPSQLNSQFLLLLAGESKPADLAVSLALAFALCAAFLLGAVLLFRKKRL